MIYCSLLKVVCCIPPHSKLCPFLSNLVKAEVINANLRMNLQIYETFPKKLFNSFTLTGGLIVAMAVAWPGPHLFPYCEPSSPGISQRTLQMHT